MTGRGPKDLVFTLFGEYLLDRVDRVWVGSLITLLEPFGVAQGAVRTALSRMVRKGWLAAHRTGRLSYYSLTDRGRRLLTEGQERIYRPTWDWPWDGRWVLFAYSIPEGSRHLRDRLRDRLAWLGFGSLGNGLWISPRDVADRALEVADQLGISEHVDCFRATRIGAATDEELVAKCWDLSAVDREYAAFVDRWGKLAVPTDVAQSYAMRFLLIHDFRRFPLLDPYLPRSLLPADWLGHDATQLFRELHDALHGPADAHVDSVLRDAPAPALSS